jgi:hypothetical protein
LVFILLGWDIDHRLFRHLYLRTALVKVVEMEGEEIHRREIGEHENGGLWMQRNLRDRRDRKGGEGLVQVLPGLAIVIFQPGQLISITCFLKILEVPVKQDIIYRLRLDSEKKVNLLLGPGKLVLKFRSPFRLRRRVLWDFGWGLSKPLREKENGISFAEEFPDLLVCQGDFFVLPFLWIHGKRRRVPFK